MIGSDFGNKDSLGCQSTYKVCGDRSVRIETILAAVEGSWRIVPGNFPRQYGEVRACNVRGVDDNGIEPCSQRCTPIANKEKRATGKSERGRVAGSRPYCVFRDIDAYAARGR